MNPVLTLDTYDVTGKKVFLRLDLNMPMDEHHRVTDASRLQASLKTLQTLHQKGAKTLIVTHLGRPKDMEDALSTRHLLPILKEHLGPVVFACTLEKAKDALGHLHDGGYILLENIRFWKEEKTHDEAFAIALSELAEIYINDAFSVCHRKHASVYQVPKHMSICLAGYGLLQEVRALKTYFDHPKRPLTVLVGGAKVSTKFMLLESLAQRADYLIVGGGMANTFLVALGSLSKGESLYEESCLRAAKVFLEKWGKKIILPIDVVASDKDRMNIRICSVGDVPSTYAVFDIGPQTLKKIKEVCDASRTILWNGPFGWFERPPFDKGSKMIAALLAARTAQGAITLAGGGDTLACLGNSKQDLTFFSTAGGAFLSYLEDADLPGLKPFNL